jgi:hypothetical protein
VPRPRASSRATSSRSTQYGYAGCMCCSSSSSRRAGSAFAGVSANPESAWVAQQARNVAFDEQLENIRYLIHDRDTKFSGPFDEVFRTKRVKVIKTPVRAPRANAVAELFVRTVRDECLDHSLLGMLR